MDTGGPPPELTVLLMPMEATKATKYKQAEPRVVVTLRAHGKDGIRCIEHADREPD
jgi:hypothetical protein